MIHKSDSGLVKVLVTLSDLSTGHRCKDVLFLFNFLLFSHFDLSLLLLAHTQEHLLHMQALDQRAQETNMENWLNPHCYPRCDRNYGYPV